MHIDNFIPNLEKRSEKYGLNFQVGKPAIETAIGAFENRNEIKIPEQIKWFYQKCNGLRIEDPPLDIESIENLDADETGKIVADFNRKADGKVRLLFLQQCGRATIQNLYNFADAAEYIMASPVTVGAPNTYYTKTLKSVAADPNITGITIAKIIMQEDEHYTFYTLIENSELKNLPERISPVIASFTQNASLKPPHTCAPIFEFEDEKFYDLMSYLQALSSANNETAAKELRDFFDWCDNNLIVCKAIKKPKTSAMSSYCGLSIYTPSDQIDLGRYNDLPLYQQTNLIKVLYPLLHQ